ncbi:MAG: hypothetical protein A2Z68_01805 [Candidatus Nealsonbacteria bacterium RBG_13_38_11]|uniref:Uncharacterized protein n=1 Tax=Candidatus Nealsonbacteria bacterium RBG_13_38_11 TaxID=1801662 RepID=A0A1G2DYL9_9BACT|nr:MAG: hypothetical protein A2Z68_01805 [Candidatus Nealsonbacteria bacterium RBG_13_38_11]
MNDIVLVVFPGMIILIALTSDFFKFLKWRLRKRYEELAERATDDTRPYSFYTQTFRDSSVQAIIGMGISVLPFIFRDLDEAKGGVHWQMITVSQILYNNDLPPVEIPEEFRGDVPVMERIYVEYGRKHGWI